MPCMPAGKQLQKSRGAVSQAGPTGIPEREPACVWPRDSVPFSASSSFKRLRRISTLRMLRGRPSSWSRSMPTAPCMQPRSRLVVSMICVCGVDGKASGPYTPPF